MAPGDRAFPVLRVNGLRKTFRREDGTPVPALRDVSIELSKGECIVLLGPSGCGKTTLLRCVAGLEAAESGEIQIKGKDVFAATRRLNLPPERRGLSMIFQSYALWPHLTALDNVAYPLQSRKIGQQETQERVRWALQLVGLESLAQQYPAQLSGGQQQRVALARAIVSKDELVLFDEPLSNVDAKVRDQVRTELRALQRELGFSALYVTHDQDEAMELADRVAVMADGEILQMGPPVEIYERPTSVRVANFVGRTNELRGTVQAVDGGAWATLSTPLGPALVSMADGTHLAPGDQVILMCRPESCQVSRNRTGLPNSWQGTVRASVFLGTHCEDVVELGKQQFRTWRPGSDLLDAGSLVWLSVRPEDLRTTPP